MCTLMVLQHCSVGIGVLQQLYYQSRGFRPSYYHHTSLVSLLFIAWIPTSFLIFNVLLCLVFVIAMMFMFY